MSATLLAGLLSSGKLRVSVAWAADPTADPDTWSYTDITKDVGQDNGNGINITVGRANGFSTAPPAQCTLRLKNPLGQYTPFNPVGSNYPNVVLGTPVKVEVSLDGGSTWNTRFKGEAASWLPRWDAQGRKAYVVLTASGITRRLGSGNKPLRSALERAIVAEGPLEYWPCEDGSSATQIASGLSGHTAANVAGLTFASDTGLVGSAPLPVFASGGSTIGPVTATPTASQWQWDWHYFMPGDPGADTPVMQINTSGTVRTWQYIVLNGGTTYQIKGFDSSGSLTVNRSFATLPEDPVSGAWSHWSFYVQDGGSGTVNWAFHYYPSLNVDFGLADGGSFSGTPGVPVSWGVPPSAGIEGTAIGHVVLYDTYNYFQPLAPAAGYAGETATDRLTRLCDEEDIALDLVGSSDIGMGPQGVDTLMALLRQCEATDLGALLDGFGPGLTYICRSSLYNENAQVTINANSGQVPATAPQPAHDDQLVRNRLTVTNNNGSTVVVEKTDGALGTATIGVFDDARSVSTESDQDLSNIASWLAHLGTVEGLRYPQFPLDFGAAPELASTWVGAVPTDRFDLTNLSSQLTQHPAGSVSLLAEGWSEFLNAKTWRATVNSSNYRPWEVFQIEDSRLGRIETDGSTLASSATSTATSLSVASSGGLWDTGSTPFDIEIEGEQLTVTAVSGSSSPQTFTATRSVNGIAKTHSSGAVVKLWKPGVIPL